MLAFHKWPSINQISYFGIRSFRASRKSKGGCLEVDNYSACPLFSQDRFFYLSCNFPPTSFSNSSGPDYFMVRNVVLLWLFILHSLSPHSISILSLVEVPDECRHLVAAFFSSQHY